LDEIDLAYLKDEKCRDEVSDIVSNYKAEKIRDIGIELNIILKDDIPVYQRARRLAMSKQREVDIQINK